MEMNVPPLAESTHRDRSIFLRHRLFPMISNMANFEVYKRRNASAPFVAWDDRWNDTENDLNNNGWLYPFFYKRETYELV